MNQLKPNSYTTIHGIMVKDPRTVAELQAIESALLYAKTPAPISWKEYIIRFQNSLDYFFSKIKGVV